MKRWLQYLKERFPLATYVLLVGGFSLSGLAFSRVSLSRTSWPLAAVSFLGVILFFAVLRLMDEEKDFEKDKIAHPTRPLPRGLLSLQEVHRVIIGGLQLMISYGLILAEVVSPTTGCLYLFITFYLFLMYKEFFGLPLIKRSAFLYGFTHQIILIPIVLFCMSVADPAILTNVVAWAYSGLILCSFFIYEICRKLNPEAHPVLQTYLSTYGAKKVAAIIVVLSIGSVVLSNYLNLKGLIPFEGLIFVIVFFLSAKPKIYKLVEATTAISLILHLWSLAINMWIF